jgi:hypothetical protein
VVADAALPLWVTGGREGTNCFRGAVLAVAAMGRLNFRNRYLIRKIAVALNVHAPVLFQS